GDGLGKGGDDRPGSAARAARPPDRSDGIRGARRPLPTGNRLPEGRIENSTAGNGRLRCGDERQRIPPPDPADLHVVDGDRSAWQQRVAELQAGRRYEQVRWVVISTFWDLANDPPAP